MTPNVPVNIIGTGGYTVGYKRPESSPSKSAPFEPPHPIAK